MTTPSGTAPRMETIDPAQYRKVLGAYPTGVCVVTGHDGATDERHALVVGSFTSISLDPPLVGFFPAVTSYTWQQLSKLDGFCVNILSASQEDVARRVASAEASERLASIAHRASEAGHPVIDGSIAWIDCAIDRIVELGDHYLVVGAVKTMGCEDDGEALVFHRRGYWSTGLTLDGAN